MQSCLAGGMCWASRIVHVWRAWLPFWGTALVLACEFVSSASSSCLHAALRVVVMCCTKCCLGAFLAAQLPWSMVSFHGWFFCCVIRIRSFARKALSHSLGLRHRNLRLAASSHRGRGCQPRRTSLYRCPYHNYLLSMVLFHGWYFAEVFFPQLPLSMVYFHGWFFCCGVCICSFA